MKLIYIANFRIPTEKAHGYQVAKMCESFARQTRRITQNGTQNNAEKIEIELVIPTRKNEIKQDLFEYYEFKRNFKVARIYVPDFIAATPLFLRKAGFILQGAFYLLRLCFLRFPKDSIIYSRNPEIIWLFALRGYKTIFESHRWPALPAGGSQTKANLHKYMVKRATKIITVTEQLKKLYLEPFADDGSPAQNNKILVAPDGVDLSVFYVDISKENARRRLNLPQDAVLLGYAGSLETMGEAKGLAEIFYALRRIARENKNSGKIMFVVVGGTKAQYERYAELTRDFGVQNSVLFIERVSRQKLAVYQKAFDILLMPFPDIEHYRYYMSPMKMFEYMASRRPVVASDLPSVREILRDPFADQRRSENQRGSAQINPRVSAQYGNAMLVEPDNPDSLAKGIEKLINEPELAQKISNQAHEDVKQYTWEKRAKKILNFIQ